MFSSDARSILRGAAKLVLELVGDEPASKMEETKTDVAKVASAVAAGAGVASKLVDFARMHSHDVARGASKKSGGSLALGLALGAAVGAGVLYLASPAGREKVRSVFHKVRGWRKPEEIAPPVS
jgi:hypothetical protein